jgi:hypothetical protein
MIFLRSLTVTSLLEGRDKMYTDLESGTLSPDTFLVREKNRRAFESELRETCERALGTAGGDDDGTAKKLLARLDEFKSLYERDFLNCHVKILREVTHRHPANDGLNDLYIAMAHRAGEEKKKLSERCDRILRQIAEKEEVISSATKHVEELRDELEGLQEPASNTAAEELRENREKRLRRVEERKLEVAEGRKKHFAKLAEL